MSESKKNIELLDEVIEECAEIERIYTRQSGPQEGHQSEGALVAAQVQRLAQVVKRREERTEKLVKLQLYIAGLSVLANADWLADLGQELGIHMTPRAGDRPGDHLPWARALLNELLSKEAE